MSKQVINIGTKPNDGTGDTLRVAFQKTNNNFTELYNTVGGDIQDQVINVLANTGAVETINSVGTLTLQSEGNNFIFSGNTLILPVGAYISNDPSLVYIRHQDGAIRMEGGANTEMVYQFDSPDGSLYHVNRSVVGVDETGSYFRLFAGDGAGGEPGPNPYGVIRQFVYSVDTMEGFGRLTFNEEHHIHTDGYNFMISYTEEPHRGWYFTSNGTMHFLTEANTSPSIVPSGPNIDIVAGTDGWAELASNDANTYIWADNNGAYIATSWQNYGKTWTFGSDGNLTIPNDIYANESNDLNVKVFSPNAETPVTFSVQNRDISNDNNKTTQFDVSGDRIVLTTDFSGNKYEWTFANTGVITLPNSSTIADVPDGDYANGVILTVNGNETKFDTGGRLHIPNDLVINYGNITLPENGDIKNFDGYSVIKSIPQNLQDSFNDYTLQLSDGGKHIYRTEGDGYGITVPINDSVSFEIGTAITIVSGGSECYFYLEDGDVTEVWGAGFNAYNQSWYIPSNSMATLLKIGTDKWMLSGAGLASNL